MKEAIADMSNTLDKKEINEYYKEAMAKIEAKMKEAKKEAKKKEPKTPKEPKEAKEPNTDYPGGKAPRKALGVKKEPKEPKEKKEKEPKEPKEPKEKKEKEPKEPKEKKEKEPKEPKEPKEKKEKKEKEPKKPKKDKKPVEVDDDGNEIVKEKKPLSAYQTFIQENRPKVKEEFPDYNGEQIFTKIAELWQQHKEQMKSAKDSSD
jgi:hypothetical protein